MSEHEQTMRDRLRQALIDETEGLHAEDTIFAQVAERYRSSRRRRTVTYTAAAGVALTLSVTGGLAMLGPGKQVQPTAELSCPKMPDAPGRASHAQKYAAEDRRSLLPAAPIAGKGCLYEAPSGEPEHTALIAQIPLNRQMLAKVADDLNAPFREGQPHCKPDTAPIRTLTITATYKNQPTLIISINIGVDCRIVTNGTRLGTFVSARPFGRLAKTLSLPAATPSAAGAWPTSYPSAPATPS